MPKRKTPVEKPEKQFERFVEAARKHEVDDEKAVADKFKALAANGKSGKVHIK